MIKNYWTTGLGFALAVINYLQGVGAELPTDGNGWLSLLFSALLAGFGVVAKDAKTGSRPMAVALFLGLMLAADPSFAAGKAILSWDANTEADLAGYKVYQGTVSGVYGPPTDVGKTATPLAPTHTFPSLADGTYFFAVTAYDTSGNESGFSLEVSKAIDSTPPKPPFNLRLLIERIIAAIKKLFGMG